MKTLPGMIAALAISGPMAALAEDGRPVTVKDLAGKTYCWNSGRVATYAANGRVSNDAGKTMDWTVVEPGVVKVGAKYQQMEVLSDGRLQMHVFNAGARVKPGGVNLYFWATPCSGSKT